MKTAAAQEHEIELVPVTGLESAAGLYEQIGEIKSRIARRAYEIYENRGKTHGHDKEDWLRAESEILRLVPVVIHETEHLYSVIAQISGFNADELKVQVEPHCIFITGRRRRGTVGGDAEQQSKEIFKSVELFSEIDVHTVIAELSNGTLTISMRKTPPCAIAKTPKAISKSSRSRYVAAAKDQLSRATTKLRKARARAEASLK